jgi:adenosine kinase
MYTSLVIAGSIASDTLFDFDGLFQNSFDANHLDNINTSFNVTKLRKNMGGNATNISYATTFFCPEKVKIIGAVGLDGLHFINFFKEHNLDIKGILIDQEKHTAFGSCITDENNNQIWGFYYGACESCQNINILDFCDKNSILMISPNHEDSFVSMQTQAIKHNIDYVYDVGMMIPSLSAEILKNGVLGAKYIIANEYEMNQLFKKTGLTEKELLEKNCIIITTLGKKGVMYKDQNQTITVPSFPNLSVDPTGAGDSWRGGFFGSLINGKNLQDSLIMGNAVASICVENNGTTNYRPTLQTLENRCSVIKNHLN